MGADGKAFARDAEAFFGCGFDADAVEFDAAGIGEIMAHFQNVRGHLGRLGDDCDIRIAQPIPFLREQADDVFEQFDAVGTAIVFVGVGEVFADVTERCRAEQGIDERMDGDIRIGMAEQPLFIRDRHTAQDELSAFDKAMKIVTVSDSHENTFISKCL